MGTFQLPPSRGAIVLQSAERSGYETIQQSKQIPWSGHGRDGTIIPLLVLVVFGITEFGTLFHVRHNMVHAARDAARVMAVQGVTPAEAQQVALDRLSGINANFTVTVTEPPAITGGNRDVSVHISVPQSDISVGIPGIDFNGTMETQITMRKEDG